MKILFHLLLAAVAFLAASCQNSLPPDVYDPQPEPDPGFVEAVPDTVTFTNADFIYYGDIAGESSSEDWVVNCTPIWRSMSLAIL